MRVTSWNCYRGAKIDASLALLAQRWRSELVALQECRRPAAEDASISWRGCDRLQGAAVVSASPALPIEPLDVPSSLHPTVVPVLVQAPQPFVFIGVWTHPDYNKVAWEAMDACVSLADGMPVVAAGDFNSSPGVKGQQQASREFLQRMRDELGLVSAYHHHFHREAHGAETRATYYHLFKESNPFHIDYCFLPEAWLGRLAGVEVGSFADWPQSDHRPLTVELTPESPGDA